MEESVEAATGVPEEKVETANEAPNDEGKLPQQILSTLDPTRFYEDDYRPCLAALVEAILHAEAPIRDERLAQRVARVHGFQRTGRRIKETVLAALPRTCKITRESDAAFIWPPGVAPSSWSVFRDPAPGNQREPAEAAIEELMVLARRVLQQTTNEEEALLLMRNACGLAQLREAARARCLEAIRRAMSSST